MNRQTLLSTLRSLGIHGGAWQWFASYLEGRSYQVTWRGSTSAPRRLSTGVPQDSVLGPLLFSLYTRSLGAVISSHGFSYHCYADDSQLIFSIPPSDTNVSARISAVAATVSGERSVKAKLHHPAVLTCDWKCPDSLKWTLFEKRDSVLAQCDQTSCRSEEGFNISHDQYLKGNPHLTITAADYSTRGLYTCQCDGKEVCDVRLVIETQVLSREITPGEPIDVHLPLTDLVEVSFTASDAAQPSDLQICTVNGEKIQIINPDYKERASRINTLQIKEGRVSDGGSYTVRDVENEETLTIVKVHVRGKRV
ncbi:hypothetical protein PDJAM_G00229870 [Pangasius djambal]|uniref:Uncharacterized protein n=1 Tax=Pangasius djambal TaxID=1691987 RepID=A0ACC5YDY0_9TELE|nr:hypothetical protein [Pangasius djambal]